MTQFIESQAKRNECYWQCSLYACLQSILNHFLLSMIFTRSNRTSKRLFQKKGKKLKFEQHNFDDNFVLDGVSLDLTDYRLWNYSIIRVTITQLNQSIILRIRTISFCFFASYFNRFFDSLLLLPFFTWLFHWAPK